MSAYRVILASSLFAIAAVGSAAADPFTFSDGNVNGLMAAASRPASAGQFEIESGDDFTTTVRTQINSASFTGLFVGGPASVANVVVEIYRVFPLDSNVARTSGAPTFSTSQVPTRVNSPSDVAFDERGVGAGLSFTTTTIASSFTAANSIAPGGIHPTPGQTTGGNGPVTGQEVQFNVSFATPFDLPSDHYFFVPQVTLTNGDTFYWLSSVRPIVAPGTPFAPDLQAWTRDDFLDPDWLRIGTDIVGGSPAPTFNLAFSLSGQAIPEPMSLALLGIGLAGLVGFRRRSMPA